MNNKAEAKTMKQGTRREMNPKRRFPEFRDAPNWIEKSLDEALSPILRERKKPVDAYTGLGMRSHGKGTFLKNFENPEKNSMEYLYEVERDDLIVNITFAWEGAIAIAKPTDTGALVSHRFPTYIFKRDAAIPDFFRYIVLDKQFVYNLGVISPGGAGRNRVLNKNDFLKLRVFLPEVSEQEKIAECLTSLDKLIDAHGQKLDALKAHKKGLMQQLFPRKGETFPSLRFPEFQNEPEWEEQKICTFAKVTTGNKDTQNKIDNGRYPFFVRSQTVERINSYAYDGEAVLTSGDGVGVGKNYHYINGKFDFHQRVYCIYEFENYVSGLFFYLYFSEHFGERVMKMSAKNSVDSIRMSMITDMPVFLPSFLEQQEIASCLSSLDEIITAQTQKLEALKTHKKGLMQQLFPSSEGGL
jgi:type I restriction enzyme, S subunit